MVAKEHMDANRLASFEEQYKAQLALFVQEKPEYLMKGISVNEAADKMLNAIKAHGIKAVNIDGEGFKRTCRSLGIKKTYKAIDEYLHGK